MTTLTAQDVARHIQRPGEPRIAAVDRFRNWAKMGLIKPTGERNPGTGRKKRYSKSAVLEAILLQTLTDALGSSAASSIGLVRESPKWCDMAHCWARVWKCLLSAGAAMRP